MDTSTRLPGHGLLSEGHPYEWRQGDEEDTPSWHRVARHWRGHGVCQCGAASPELDTNGARKRWHKDHKQAERIAEGPFEVLARRIRAEGEPYHGDLLRDTANTASVVCQSCGPLPPPHTHGWTSDWITLCHDVMDHAKETGHQVAVESWHGAIYGREEASDA